MTPFRRGGGRERVRAVTIGIVASLGLVAGCAVKTEPVLTPDEAARAGKLLEQEMVQSQTPADEKVAEELQPLAAGEATRIGILAPLSGEHAELGAQIVDAATLALFENEGRAIHLIPYDTEGTPEGAKRAAEKAVAEKARLLMGPVFSASVEAIKPVIGAVKAISFSNDRSVAGDGVFLLGRHPEEQVEQVIRHAAAAGLKRLVYFSPNTPHGQRLLEVIQEVADEGVFTLVDTVIYPPEITFTEVSEIVRKATRFDQRKANLESLTDAFAKAWTEAAPQAATGTAPENEPQNETENETENEPANRDPDALAFKVLKDLTSRDPVPEEPWEPSEFESGEGRTTGLPQTLYAARVQALDSLVLRFKDNWVEGEDPDDTMHAAIEDLRTRETLGPVGFDGVILPIGGSNLLVIAPMFEYFYAALPEVRLLGTGIWQTANLKRERSLHGGWYGSSASGARSWFDTRTQALFGSYFSDVAALAYDAVSLAVASERESGRGMFATAFLTDEAGFIGVDGWFRLTEQGPNVRHVTIREVGPDGEKILGPSPTVFAGEGESEESPRRIARENPVETPEPMAPEPTASKAVPDTAPPVPAPEDPSNIKNP